MQILNIGKDHATVSRFVLSSGVQDIEMKIEELINENIKLERDVEREGLLQKKKSWLEFEAQTVGVESLSYAKELLIEQLRQVEERLQSVEEKLASVGESSSFGQILTNLLAKENENKDFITKQLRPTENEYTNANEKLARLRSKAEEMAPEKDWYARLSQSDMPVDLNNANTELRNIKSSIKSIKTTRLGLQRMADIDGVKVGLGLLFQTVNVGTNDMGKKAKKRKSLENLDETEDEMPGTIKRKKVTSIEEWWWWWE